MINGEGFITRVGKRRTERATLKETRGGVEYAVTQDGLVVMPLAYEVETIYEIESEEDAIEVSAILEAIARES